MQMYQVDAFTDQLFAGNPAALLMLDEWLPDDLMLSVAQENNLAETAFVKACGFQCIPPTHTDFKSPSVLI